MNRLTAVKVQRKLHVAMLQQEPDSGWGREIRTQFSGNPRIVFMLPDNLTTDSVPQHAGQPDLAFVQVLNRDVERGIRLIDQLRRRSCKVIVVGHRKLAPFRLVLAHCGAIDTVTSGADWARVAKVVTRLANEQPFVMQDWRDQFFDRIPWNQPLKRGFEHQPKNN